jgi:NADPH:quinone reductase-like Zn-dependent oxidoreductase
MGTVFDLVVDNVGLPAPLYKECHHFLKPSGKFVQIGASASFNSAINLASRMLQPGFLGGGHRPFVFWQAKQNREHLVEIGRLLAEGKARAIFEHIFDWEDVPKAYQKLKTGRARGKIVVHITES